MLADAHALYSSGTFWGAVGAVAAVAAVGVAIVLWRVGAPRRVLVYEMVTSSSLLSSHAAGFTEGHLQVTMDGKALSDPWVAVVRLENKSRRDIRSSDFDQEKPLTLDLHRGIAMLRAEPAEESLVLHDSKITIGPALIRGGSRLDMTLVTDGPPFLTCQSFLVDVKVQEYGITTAGDWLRLIGMGIVIAAIVALLAARYAAWQAGILGGIAALMLFEITWARVHNRPRKG